MCLNNSNNTLKVCTFENKCVRGGGGGYMYTLLPSNKSIILQENRDCNQHSGELCDDRRHCVRDRLRQGQDEDVRPNEELCHAQTRMDQETFLLYYHQVIQNRHI